MKKRARVYIDRGCRLALCLLSHACPRCRPRGAVYIPERAELWRQQFHLYSVHGRLNNRLCLCVVFSRESCTYGWKSDYSRRDGEFRAQFTVVDRTYVRSTVDVEQLRCSEVELEKDVCAEPRERVLCAVDRWTRSSWTDTLSPATPVNWGTTTTPRERTEERRRVNYDAAVPWRTTSTRSRHRDEVAAVAFCRASTTPTEARRPRRWPAAVDAVLLKLPLSRVLSSMLRLYVRVVCLF